MGVGGVDRLGGHLLGTRRDRDPATTTFSTQAIGALCGRLGTGGPRELPRADSGVGGPGDRDRQGQGRQTCAQRDAAHAAPFLGRLLRGRSLRLLRQDVGVGTSEGSHEGTSFQSTASATVVETLQWRQLATSLPCDPPPIAMVPAPVSQGDGRRRRRSRCRAGREDAPGGPPRLSTSRRTRSGPRPSRGSRSGRRCSSDPR